MRVRARLTARLIALTAVAAVGAGLLVASPAEAARPAAPTHVRTTIRLTPSDLYRIDVTGRTTAGATVVLQDRYDEHDNWVTQDRTTATPRGTFRVHVVPPEQYSGHYRVCVVRSGVMACAHGGAKHIVKVKGKITLTKTAPQLVPYETDVIAEGKVSRVLRGYPEIRAQYLHPVTGRWELIPWAKVTMLDEARFRISVGRAFPGLTSKQGQLLRLLVPSNPWLRNTTKTWRADSYAQQSLINLPVESGSWMSGHVTDAFGFSEAVSPTNTVTVTVPPGCGRVQAGISQDLTLSGLGPYSASVARNGVTAWSYDSLAPGPTTFSLDVSGGDQLTFTVTFDPGHADWRPWFVSPLSPTVTTDRHPFALCSAP